MSTTEDCPHRVFAGERHRFSLVVLVGGTGIEPVASSVSGKRSPAELTAREAEAGIEPAYRACRPLPKPLGHSATGRPPRGGPARVPEEPRGRIPRGAAPGTSERTTGFEPATLTLAR